MVVLTAPSEANKMHPQAVDYLVVQIDYSSGLWSFDICPIIEATESELLAAKKDCSTCISTFAECEQFVRDWAY